MALYVWPGEPLNPASQHSGVQWIRALRWVPYQKSTFVTPAFPGYTSGHSTFSRAAAEVLTAFTGSAFFPGELAEFVAPQGEFLTFDCRPGTHCTLVPVVCFRAPCPPVAHCVLARPGNRRSR